MGQQLFKVHLNSNDNIPDTSNTISSDDIKDDLTFFFPVKSSSPDLQRLNNDPHISNLQIEYIKQIRNHLFLLTKSTQWERINTEINETFIENILTSILDENKKVLEEQNNRLTYKQQLQTSLTTKLDDENNINQSIFSESSNDSISDDSATSDEDIEKQLSYFGLQSLTFILFILIKSAEKHDPTLVYQILTLTNKLCEQLPMKCLSSTTNLLFKSLEPLTIYIEQLSLSSDRILSKQTIEIQLYFSIAKGSFKDLLPLLNKLIFDTNDIYNLQRLFLHMNKYLTKTINEYDKNKNSVEKHVTGFNSLNYLKSINAFPNTQLIKQNKEFFTGQMICSIILSHIDIENEIINSSSKQLKSLSCEFHSNTFKYLFYIIEKLTKFSPSNETINHILSICLRLFTNHLQLLSDLKSHISDLTIYATNDELKTWFDLLLKLFSNEKVKDVIGKEACKAFIYIIDIDPSSLTEKLEIIYQYIIENKHLILIEQLLIELNKNELLLNWIENLSDKNKKIKSFEILYSFINLYFNGEEKQKSEIKQILFSFQNLLLSQLIIQSETKTLSNNEHQLSDVISQYLIYIFKYCIEHKLSMNDLLNSALIGLCLMTEINKSFIYEDIQPIFISILPLLTEYYLENINNEDNEFVICLIGRICNVLINGLPQDSLEKKHLNKFQSATFDGGCVFDKNDDLLKSNLAVYNEFELKEEKEDDKDFLMSIYKNVNGGRELISKLKLHIKDKQRLQQSIEEVANNACAAMFSVYVKFYRRINLAKSELLRTDENKPFNQLLSIYQYANRIQSLFATVKGQGGDCNELYQQIKIRALFLLSSIKESHFIPIIQQDLPSTIADIKPKILNQFQRQQSRWTKAKTIIKLLQNLLRVCVRFRKFMLQKKQINEQKYDYESLLSQSIDQFVYGDFYKSLTSITNQEKQLEINELEKCLHRQQRRAIIRLTTYRFIKTFIQNILNLNNNDKSFKLLSICLPYLSKNDIDWSYFNDIQASNNQLKYEISNSYYSIIKLILSSTSLTENMFYLLNISYESIDISHLFSHEIIETLFNSFVHSINQSEHKSSLRLKLIGFNWFRLFAFKLCENIETDKLRNTSNEFLEQQNLVFNKLILDEIKSSKEHLSTNSQEEENSLKNLSLCWFVQSNQSMDVYLNQYLALLLRSMYFYKHVISVCATNDYLETLISIYYHNQSRITQILIIKLLRYLIPSISDDNDGIARNMIEKFLLDVLNRIGDKNSSKEIVSELIFMYRQVISTNNSLWDMKARELVFSSIKSHLNEKFPQTNEINQLVASLCILGGYIESYRLGSIVKTETNDEISSGLIINIDEKDKTYLIQYLQTNEIESIPIDKLKHEIDILPPNLIDSNDSIIDILGSFIQIDTSTNNQPLILLELKRRSLCVLSHLLNDKKLIEIFMNKSYASSLAKLCRLKTTPPSDLGVFNKLNLEEYCLSLDNCQINDDDKNVDLISTIDELSNEVNRNELIVNALSKSMNGWRPYAFESEVELFRKGRIGNDEISIVPMPRHTVTIKATEECGINHRFHGRIDPKDQRMEYDFPTFIVENLELSEGNWYYCVRLLSGGLVQIGWATEGFSPAGASTGVGDDSFSWSYDGSRGVFFHAEGFYGVYDDIRWKENDVCGCGIEINGKNTRIKYWLNGKLLGTAFAHDSTIASSSTECDLLPNGPATTYYPAITVSWESMLTTCQLIFSPEDMQDCPLPNGYKPLFLPKVVQSENSIVDYPSNAYLVGDNPENFVANKRTKSEMIILRDFVHEEHIETKFNLDDQYLSLPDNSDGFLLSLDNNNEITISFDFQILSTDNQNDFSLFKFNSTEVPLKTTDEKQQCVIILLLKEQQIKVYINNKSQQIFNHVFQNETNEKVNINLLPKISARIQNIAIWKYDLSEEEISRLFTYRLFYIKNEFEELQEYRKRVNTISFSKNQKEFTNEILLPFDEPFTDEVWMEKKKQADDNESKYFKSYEDKNEDYSTVELFGNKTYLVLNKLNEEWYNYTFILHISIPQYPITDEKLTIITLNSKCEVYLTSNGKICLEHKEDKVESSSSINLNEYFCLFIRVHEQSIQIYMNNNLEIDLIVTDDRFYMTSNQIDLFKENDLTKNSTNEDQLRLSLKSITYLNRSISIDELQSSTLIPPPFEIIGRNLLALGYKKHWIESMIKENGSKDLSTNLRKRKEGLIKTDLENERKRYIKVCSNLYPSNNSEVMENVINCSQLDTKEGVNEVKEHIFTYLISSQPTDLPFDATKFGENWFSQSVEGLDIPQNINEWLRDGKLKSDDKNSYELLDLTQLITKESKKSMKYSHENLSSKQYLKSRIACENGLITAYAHSTIINILKIWSTDDSTLFPLEKFEDYSILQLIDYTQIGKKESVDQVYSLIKSILKSEIKHLCEHANRDDLQAKVPSFNYLQKDIMTQIIQTLLKTSEKQINFSFILSILNLFIELLSDKSFLKQHQIDLIIPIIFPTSLINLLFKLFLLIPTNQSKISVLYLFNSLFRLNESKIILNNHIQQFFFQLLIDLSSDKISMNDNLKNKFQIALTDLIYILLAKENNQLEQYRSNLPENIQNLLTTIDVINVWTDPAKEKLLPEKFFERSSDILDNIYKLNQEDFEKSNADFNISADRELVSLIKDYLLDHAYVSLSDLIETFPTESVPTLSFYKRFISLPNIPVDSIQIRVRFIILLNKFIELIIPTIDFSLPSGQSFITDQIRKIKLYLVMVGKFSTLRRALEKTTTLSFDQLSINFDTVKASTDTEKDENTMFYQAYQQLHKNAHITFRRSVEQIWQAQYLEMHSTDAGGPYRDSITRICLDICSTRLPLFILCPNGRTSSGLNRDCWIPNVFPPNKSISIKFQKQYRFVGQLMGMAIRKKHYLDVKFPILLWKQLLKEQITMEDIEAIDAQSFTVINEMEKNMEEIKSMGIDQDVDSVFSSIMSELRFDIVSSSGQTYELIPDGKDIPIASSNFKQYCKYYREYRLNEFNRQINYIREGLYSVIPCYYLNLFTANELEEMVCGKGRIDVEILKRNTSYGGEYEQNSPVIERFWTVLDEMFNDEQRKLFLIFVWGRSTLPVQDDDFRSKFIINPLYSSEGDVDKTLPQSHTCFFTIDLPNYSTTDVMYDRLNYAITSCSSIDGDGLLNDTANLSHFDSDDD